MQWFPQNCMYTSPWLADMVRATSSCHPTYLVLQNFCAHNQCHQHHQPFYAWAGSSLKIAQKMLVKSSWCCSSGKARILSPRCFGAEACAATSLWSWSWLGSNSSWRAVCLWPRSTHLLGTSLLGFFNCVNAMLYISSQFLHWLSRLSSLCGHKWQPIYFNWCPIEFKCGFCWLQLGPMNHRG